LTILAKNRYSGLTAQGEPKRRTKMNTYAETLATNLKSFLNKDTIKVVCFCGKCNAMLPIKIDDLAQLLEADGVDYDNYKSYGKWCHKYIQENA
jgi:hypothetical protein